MSNVIMTACYLRAVGSSVRQEIDNDVKHRRIVFLASLQTTGGYTASQIIGMVSKDYTFFVY